MIKIIYKNFDITSRNFLKASSKVSVISSFSNSPDLHKMVSSGWPNFARLRLIFRTCENSKILNQPIAQETASSDQFPRFRIAPEMSKKLQTRSSYYYLRKFSMNLGSQPWFQIPRPSVFQAALCLWDQWLVPKQQVSYCSNEIPMSCCSLAQSELRQTITLQRSHDESRNSVITHDDSAAFQWRRVYGGTGGQRWSSLAQNSWGGAVQNFKWKNRTICWHYVIIHKEEL